MNGTTPVLKKQKIALILASMALLGIATVSLTAQANEPEGKPAGGSWMEFDHTDPMTGYQEARFVLQSGNTLADSTQKAMVQVICVHGKYKLGDFRPNGRLGRPNFPGFWGQPQMEVLVRVDDRHNKRAWNWVRGDFLSMDKGTVRGLIGAQIFNVEFRSPRGSQIAEFSPAGLDLGRVHQACDLTPKKPISD